MTKEEIIKKLRDMAKYPTVTLPRDTEALRNAADLLEQAQQAQPVAWRIRGTSPMSEWTLMYKNPKCEEKFSNMEIQPLYTSPPPRQPLTDAELERLYDAHAKYQEYGAWVSGWFEFARAIEARLKEKNT